MALKDELRSYIVASGATVSSTAEQMGITQSALSQRINNESIKYKDAVHLADLLGYDIVWQKRK